MTVETRTKTFSVMEIFGPTIQGEGALAGLPTYFVRFGGCDYRCSWCDSMFAVEPAEVREHARAMSADEIVAELAPGAADWVTLSGGNPALYGLEDLVAGLRAVGFKVAVETQGSVWRPWLGQVDCLTVSPKPPSSGMATEKNARQADSFMLKATVATGRGQRALKIVVFDDADFAWAAKFIRRNPDWPAYLSAGTNPIGNWGSEVVSAISTRQVRDDVGERYRWLCEKVAGEERLGGVRVLPQLHVIAWGHARAV